MRIKTLVEDNSPTRLMPSVRNKMLRTEFQRMGEKWHKSFMPDHFKRIAFSKYGYTPRKPGYVKRKLKKSLGNLPLVLTGASRDLAKQKKVYATSKGVSVTMPVRVFNFKLKRSTIDMRQEFTTIAPEEITEIEKLAESGLVKQLQNYRGRGRWDTA